MIRQRCRALLVVFVSIALTSLIIYRFIGDETDDLANRRPRNHQESAGAKSPWRNLQEHDPRRKMNLMNRPPLFQGHRVVHLDLKGAPPKMTYFAYLFPLLRTLGADMLLVEYEDMFPYSGDIRNASARNSYTLEDISALRKLARDNDLGMIPLVQSFGHLESVLKLEEFQDLREVFSYPQVLCPSNERSTKVVLGMIDQIVAAHEGELEYIHIGADEVYYIGECAKCGEVLARKRWNKKQLFLDHVQKVAGYVRKTYPGVKVLMWDDEFRDVEPYEIIDR